MNLKIFIVCLDKENALNIAKNIIKINDNLTVIPRFTTDDNYNEINENYMYYLDVHKVNLSYKNNALLYIKTNNYISEGITIDDFYNNDISFLNFEEFNLIPDIIFKKYNILTVWIDSKNHKNISKSDIIEINYFCKFIENNKYLYFLDNEYNICDVILDYISGDDEHKKIILEENS